MRTDDLPRASKAAALACVWRGARSNFRASPLGSLVATATIALCLFLLGVFALGVANMQNVLERFGEEIRLSAYLDDALSESEQQQLAERVRIAPGVQAVEWVSRAQALERFRAHQPEHAALLEGFDTNPLPASLEIALEPARRDAEGLRVLRESLTGLPGISALGAGGEWIEGYANVAALLAGVSLALGCVLVLATLLIVANTIRLSLYARSAEIEITRLVGGSRSFVAAPFLFEGLLEGCAGGALGLLLLAAGYHLLKPALAGGLALVLGYAEPVFLSPAASAVLFAMAAALGFCGAAIALLQDGLRS